MGIASIFKHIADSLWAVGGIGAAADLGLEDFCPHPFRPGPALVACPVELSGVRGSRRPARPRTHGAPAPQPLEAELCCSPCTRRSVR